LASWPTLAAELARCSPAQAGRESLGREIDESKDFLKFRKHVISSKKAWKRGKLALDSVLVGPDFLPASRLRGRSVIFGRAAAKETDIGGKFHLS
jgi:hypothetical protein